MVQSIPCYLPIIRPSVDEVKRLISTRIRTTPDESIRLLSVWKHGELEHLLQATWALLLYRYTGSEDISFGYQHLGEHTTSKVQPDSATLSLFRLNIVEDESIQQVLKKIQCGLTPTAAPQDRSPSDSDHLLFNTTLLVQICSDPGVNVLDNIVQPDLAIMPPEECFVRLHVKISNHDVGVFVEWWKDKVSEEHIGSLVEYLEETLHCILSAEDITVTDLNTLAKKDWNRVCKFNSALKETPDRCIHDIIHEQTLAHPEKEAVCAWDGSMTYQELDILASRLANYLRAQGVRAETNVALCFDKSKWYIVAVLGVLKAGGAFVPLDPTHPTARLQSLAKSVHAQIILCSRNRAEYLRDITQNLVPLDDATLRELACPSGKYKTPPVVQGSNAAYIIFTSGSTGEPKGTLMEHKSYVASSLAHATPLHINSDSRVLQFAAHTFDASLVDILTVLMHGACICIPSEEQRLNNIVKAINDLGVNHASLTPSFVDFIDISEVPGLETLALVGETMSQSHIDTWSKINLVNGFGPTECAVTAAMNPKVTPLSDVRDIGFPTGVKCWIVDPADHDRLVPVGCVGEMLLEGPTLARCYTNNPQKTVEAFIYDPKWIEKSDPVTNRRRFYKTGDLVRYNSESGALTYLGRKDTQIKLHGQRVELGEIEDHLNSDPDVKHCLVTLPKTGFSEGRLAAIISLSEPVDGDVLNPELLKLILGPKKAAKISQIRTRLSMCLPAYMIPSAWLCVEALPLLVSRKLDRKAIAKWVGEVEEDPDILSKSCDQDQKDAVFENMVEDQIATIWGRVLNIPKSHIGPNESFLSLGGDSIAAITCIGFCKKNGIGITVQEVLRSKSIKDLATRAKAIEQPASYEEVVEKPFPLSPIQKLHFIARAEGQGHFNQSVLARLNHEIDENNIRRGIELLIKHHSMLRARLVDSGPDYGLQQKITKDIIGSYRWRAHNTTCPQDIEKAIAASQSSINAIVGPLVAVDFFQGKGQNSILSIVAHHLVVDIVSWRVILEDLESLLTDDHSAMKQHSSLPFQIWCQLQIDQCQSLAEENSDVFSIPAPDMAYWGIENDSITYGDMDCESFEIDEESTRCLLVGCHESLQTEPNDVFLAVVLHAFHKTFTGRPLPVIYNEGHGREVWDSSIDISRTVGWFTILHPILISGLICDNLIETIVHVKDYRRRVSDHGREKFAKRMCIDQGNQDSNHHCPMEIVFNYVGQHRDLQRQDGLFQLVNQMAGETGRGGDAADFGEDTPRFALFEISAMAAQGKLRFNFSFSRYIKHQNAIREWISCCYHLLEHVGPKLQALPPRPTLSDFANLSLDYQELEDIFSTKLPEVGINTPAMIEDIYPCTRMQEGILLSRLRDESFYAVHKCFEVTSHGSKPDITLLTAAWKRVVSRHPLLRTVFVEGLTSRFPFSQVVLKSFEQDPDFVRCTDEDEVLTALEKKQPTSSIRNRPPHRFVICETASGKVFCKLEISHAVMDGSSISIILQDLRLAYEGSLKDGRTPMFKSFVQYLQDPARMDSLKYWKAYLSNARPCHFPVLNDGISTPKKLQTVRLSLEFYEALQRGCEKSGFTLSTAFSVAWGLTLRSFCQSDDVYFSYMTSLRDIPVEDVNEVVGPVINLLICRMHMSESTSLREVLSQVQHNYMEHLPHRHSSLIDIHHALKLSDTLFNTGLSYRKLPPSDIKPNESLNFTELGTVYDPAEFPIFVNIEVTENEALVDLNYWVTALSDGQAKSVASTFLKHLESIISFQDKAVSHMDGVSSWHTEQITGWNMSHPEMINGHLHEVVSDKAGAQPADCAVAAWDGSLTYSELDELSTTLAAYLAELGEGTGSFVPMDFGRSLWTIVAILAVLKIGGICVPLLPECLSAVLNEHMANSKIQVALASPARAHSMEGIIPHIITVDKALFKNFEKSKGTNPVFRHPVNEAYIILSLNESSTSREVVLDHRTILTRANVFASALNLNSKTRVFQTSEFMFDMFLQETFGTFLCGGCVCIPADNRIDNPAPSINLLHANMISTTPSIVLNMRPSDVPEVDTLVLYGESMKPKVRNMWTGSVKIHAFYGTAECSSSCIHKSCFYEATEEATIGRSIGGATWLVNPNDGGSLVPIGCVGELIVEGPVVSRGCNDSKNAIRETTGQLREIAHFANIPHQISLQNRYICKTGDLARYNSDGTLVYMGKKGMEAAALHETTLRIEECIDTLLPPEDYCYVESIDFGDQTPGTLVAFITLDTMHTTATSIQHRTILEPSAEFYQLVHHVHTNLPQYLPTSELPDMFVPVSKLPLTRLGKLSRQKLRDAMKGLAQEAIIRFKVKQALESGRSAHQNSYSPNATLEYWKEYLLGVESCLFPPLQQTSAPRTFRSVDLSVKSWLQPHNLHEQGLELGSLIRIAWGLVLRCYTSSETVCFGYSHLKQSSEDTVHARNGAIGAVIPFAMNLVDDMELQTALDKSRDTFSQNIQYPISLCELLQELPSNGVMLFNSILQYSELSENETHFESSAMPTEPDMSTCIINVRALASKSLKKITFSYATDCFSVDGIADIMECFEKILFFVAKNDKPGSLLAEVDFVTERSCRQIREWNGELHDRPTRCAHEFIQEQVSIMPPSAPAICSWDGDFTYSDLDVLSNRLAHHLRRLGVKPESYVALLFEKSAWAVIAQVAVLKSGGAFVCLDPTHPKDRLYTLVNVIGAEVALCSSRYLGIASSACSVAVSVCESTMNGLPSSDSTPPTMQTIATNAAYAVFTSGTTGIPKLSVLEHVGLSEVSSALSKEYKICPSTRVINFSSYTFDVGIADTIIVLMHGGCVCVPSEEERLNDLAGAIRRMGANMILAPPSIENTLDPEAVPGLKTVVAGGEKMTQGHIQRWADRCVINSYGPSETTIFATSCTIVDWDGRRVVQDCSTIGTAICGRTWVVDPFNHHRLLPVGAVGELVIEGCHVARGYLGNEQKTKEVFIKDPNWKNHPGLQKVLRRRERMYRTGDLVRYKPDGSLCFISRKDTQVKLNGVRIELQEIEQQCIRFLPPGTEVAVEVITPQVKTVARCLVAFFTVKRKPRSNEEPPELFVPMTDHIRRQMEELESSLKTSLPSIFIPKFFVPLARLPFTSSGKLDRKHIRSLIEPLHKEQLKVYSVFKSGTAQAIEGGLAEVLKFLWEETLGLEAGSVSNQDSFFGIGGDSFSAMKLVGAASSRGISLKVSDIYAQPVFSNMVRNCQRRQMATQKKPAVEPFSLLPKSLDRDMLVSEISEQCHVEKETISDIYPCSPVQEGLFTLSVKQPGAYIARAVFRLSEEIDIERFKAAWQQVVGEFEILRTRIVHTDPMKFVQAVLEEDHIIWRVVTSFDDLVGNDLEPSEPNGGPLTAYSIVRQTGLSTAYFVWTIHHALYDGWMLSKVFRRVQDIYFGTTVQSKTTPYKEFIRHLLEQDAAASGTFWKSHLANLASNPFPSNKPALSTSVKIGNRYSNIMDIPQSVHKGGLTLPELIRAAWAIIVAAHTGSSDVCFGETLMGRNVDLPGITDVVGPVLTTIPIRLQVDNGLLVTQYLQTIRDLSTAMLPHQHYGLQQIRRIGSDGYLASDFQNILVIQSDEGGLNADLWAPEGNQSDQDFFAHPLTVECKIVKSKLEITAHHDEIILDSWTTEKVVHQFICVLEQLLTISKYDERKIGDLEVSSPFDRTEIALWNKRSPFCIDRCVHDIIREKCSSQLSAPAVCAWDGQLSYEETYRVASSFAKYLTSCGIGPEALVPFCLDKSVWTVVSILGILISGAAFVPLDPSHPTSRHKEILEEIGARAILCSPHYHNRYAGLVKTIIPVSKETIRGYGNIAKGVKCPTNVRPSNMAFAIFTSGSTGRPKGIIIDHRALASSTMAFGPIVRLEKNTRAFQFASLTFDAAVMEVIATLIHGGCICIPSEDERLNDIAGAIQRMNVSWAFLTPSIASIIEPSQVPSLKVLVCGGEKLSREVALKWAHRVRLINGYGPTETTIFAVLNDVTANPEPAIIGHGIPCTLTWVVNPENHSQLAPLGAIGELALEGPALAREYLNSPQKTADAFVVDPAWMKKFPSAQACPRRIYKTGDLVKYSPDGSIEYIGRKDHQVKLHGQRMELGEIEHRLYEDSRVRHAVVILPKSGLLQGRLVAIVSLDSLTKDKGIISHGPCELVGQDMMALAYIELTEIQRNMESQLPIYMVPQTWAVIKSLPMLVSGKLDRKRITQWVENVDSPTHDRIMQDYDSIKLRNFEPQTDRAENSVLDMLRDVFIQVLNIPSHKFDLSRSFVSLGGDSITGMAVISKARKFGLSLTLHSVLQSKSIKELALVSNTRTPVFEEKERLEEPFDLSPIQRMYLQTANGLRGSARFNQGIRVRLAKYIKPDIISRAVREVIDRHSMFRARFSKSSTGQWRQRIVKDTGSSYRFRAHSVKDQHEMLVKIAESQRILDIQNGPIFAADLLQIGDNSQVLALVASHLCVDMVSWRIVLQDLQDYIETGSLSQDKTLSFQNWCELQTKNAMDSDSIQLPFAVNPPDLGYWGMEACPNLYGNVKMETFAVDKDATAFILGGCHDVLRTETVEVLLATVIQSFSQVFKDREPPTMYNEGHGREAWDPSIDVSRTVGWFTTICPLHIREGQNIVETLKYVKDMRRKVVGQSRSHFVQSLLCTKKKGSTPFPVPVEMLFNYLGKLQQLEGANKLFQHSGDNFSTEAFELAGDMGPETPRFALFEISAIVIAEQLHVSFTYNRHMLHGPRIQEWVSKCKQCIENDILLMKDWISEPTLADYPLLPITYAGLDSIIRDTLPRAGIEAWQSVEDIYPCSSVQEGILLSQLRDPHSYMFHTILEARGLDDNHRVEVDKLRKAWAMVIERHCVLRTIFIESHYKGGSFDQIVLKLVDDDIVEFECDDRIAFETLDNIKLADINANRPSKLPQQFTICSTTSGRVFLKIEINHVIIDGASIDILLRDLVLAYKDELTRSGPLYSDYIKYVRTTNHSKALTYWVDYLSGVHPCHLSFPKGTSVDRQLGSTFMSFDRFTELETFCETNSVTLANLTLSAWAIVLRSFTGADDVCFGYLSAGRDSPVPGIQDAVGIFINMLCCRVKFTADKTLGDISRDVQHDYIESLQHQVCSLAQIQHELGREGQMLFNTALSIQNHSVAEKPKDDAISFDIKKAHDPTEYPITVNVETAKDKEGVLIRYWTDVVSDSQAKSLADAIAQVFNSFLEGPSTLVSSVALCSQPPKKVSGVVKNSPGTELDEKYLQDMIDRRVEEVISQMVRDGVLAIPNAQEKKISQSKAPRLASIDINFSEKEMAHKVTLSDSMITLAEDTKELNPLESRLWNLWSSALGLPPDTVRRKASFFKSGGDSIAAMKMVGAAREEGLTLSVADVFKNPVFEDMLAAVCAKGSSSSCSSDTSKTPSIDRLSASPVLISRSMSPEEITLVKPIETWDDASLQAGICPKIGVFRGGIADVLPLTDFQAMSITGNLFKSRWMLNYFYLNGSGPLDTRRLRESFLRVVDAFDILRTVFVCFHGQFFQVILRKMRPEIFVQETDKSLDEYTESLQQRDRDQDPRQGEQYVQFYIVKQNGTDLHRILIRMSHAQYDGVCLPRIMSAIKMGYEGSPIPPAPSFANYMRMLPGTISPEHYQHWRTLLRGSKMTEIIRRHTTNSFQHIGAYEQPEKIIEIPAAALGNVTIATVMQSAWALTLAKLSAQSDVVFGLTITGRNATVPGIESIVGPCLNIIPVRVTFGDRWNGLDLFRYLQDQQVSNMAFESLGFREIFRQCTDWPGSTYFTTNVFHQSLGYEREMQLDDRAYRMGGAGVVDNFADLTLFSRQSNEHSLQVCLGYSRRSPFQPAYISKVLDMVCETVQNLVTNPSIALPSPKTLRSLPSQLINDNPRPSDEEFLSSNLNSRSISEILVHSDMIGHIWNDVLPNKTPEVPRQPFQLNSSFFDLGGDIFNMAQVVWLLEQEGLHVRLEDLLEHPTFLGHMALLALHKSTQELLAENTAPEAPLPIVPNVVSKNATWNPLGKAMTLAKRISKWNMVSKT